MKVSRLILGGAMVAALLSGACEQDLASIPARDHSAEAAVIETSAPAPAAPDPRDAPVPVFEGRPLWSANSTFTAEENARDHFERNAESFGVATMEEYVDLAHDFTGNPPETAETIVRSRNGDVLVYDYAQNVFAVMTAEGAPRTMFRPDNGADYWERQKEIEAEAANDN